jgi:hypothetical protein
MEYNDDKTTQTKYKIETVIQVIKNKIFELEYHDL